MNMYVKYIYIHYVYKVQLSTYPHTKFDIFISDCLHIESYSWYGGHGLAQLQFVKYSYSVLRLQTLETLAGYNIISSRKYQREC